MRYDHRLRPAALKPVFYTNERLPEFDYSVVRDLTRSWTVLQEPDHVNRSFKVFTLLSADLKPQMGTAVPSSKVLVMARSDDVEGFLGKDEGAFVIVVHPGDRPPSWATDYKNRILVIKEEMSFSHYSLILQDYVTRFYFWMHDLHNVIQQKSSLQTLIDVSEQFLDCYMAILENTYSLFAFSTDHEPPAAYREELSDLRRLSPSTLERLERRPRERRGKVTFRTLGTDGTSDEDALLIFFPLTSRGAPLGHVLLSQRTGRVNDGFIHLAEKLLESAEGLCDNLWSIEVSDGSPTFSLSLFNRLLLTDHPASGDIRSCEEMIGAETDSVFCLFLVRRSHLRSSVERAKLFVTVMGFENLRSWPFFFEDNICCLLQGTTDDRELGTTRTLRFLTETVCDSFRVDVGLSDRFGAISSIRDAYDQAKISLRHKAEVDMERIGEEPRGHHVYPFQDACFYDLLQKAGRTGAHLPGIGSESNSLDRLIEWDHAGNSNDFRLLWVFLQCHMNMSATAKAVFMARNTVASHIDAIVRRLDLDFTDEFLPSRLTTLYRLKFFQICEGDDQ